MFKKLCSVLAVVMMGFAVFAGCDLVTLDTNRYLNQVVATAGENVKITKEDLRQGYASFGYQYVDSYGYSVEKAVRETLNILINRALVLEYVKNTEDGNKVSLTIAQDNAAWQQVYDYLNGQIQALEKTIMTEKGMNSLVEGNEPTGELGVVYTPYQKTYTLEAGVLTKVAAPEKTENFSISPYITGVAPADKYTSMFNEFKTKYWVHTNDTIKADAMTRYLRNLKNGEKGRNFSTVDAEVFARELDRVYKVYKENKYLEVFQASHEKTISVTNTQAIDWYANTYAAQQTLYAADTASYNKAMQGEAGSIFYHPAGVDWFRVSHILLPYSETQKTKLKSLETDLGNYKITQADYDKEVAKINASVVVTEYDSNGKSVGTKYASTVLAELNQALTGKDYYTKCAIFKDFIYRYNTDPGVQNAEYNYYIPADSTYDTMVPTFADASRELRDAGLLGAVSGLVESEFGYHIIFYIGDIDLPDVSTANIYNLDATRLSVFGNKTLLDKACESVTLASYGDYETLLITQLKGELQKNGQEIKIWDAYIKELWGK